MEGVLIAMQIIALVAVTILCVYIIVVLVRLRSLLTIVESDIKEISSKAIPVLNNIEIITEKVRNVAENIDEQVDLVKTSINSIREITDNIAGFEKRVQDRIEEPVMETIGTIAAVIKGMRTFFARLRA